jgi:ABC-type multidrug transport system fused ATPase/permease subunit
VLLVTHRPELAELADRVVVLERGRIAERSTPVPA